jgi:hypothetical protein
LAAVAFRERIARKRWQCPGYAPPALRVLAQESAEIAGESVVTGQRAVQIEQREYAPGKRGACDGV